MTAATLEHPTRTLADLPGPRGLPLLGNLLQIRPERFHLQLEDWQRRYGPLYRFQLGGKPVLVCSDTALMQAAARERPARWRRWRAIESVFDEMGANGVFSVEGPAWNRQRRLVMQALNASHFRGFFPAMQCITERLLRRLARHAAYGEEVEMLDVLTRYTVDVTTTLAFGEDPNTLEAGGDVIQQHLMQVFPTVMKRVTAPWPYWRYLPLPADRRFERSLAAVHDHVQGLIDRNRSAMAANPGAAPANLLQTLLAARDDDGGGLTDAEVFANVFTVLLGGEDTTANAIAWTLPFLSADRGLQQRLHAEARTAFGDARVCPDHERLKPLELAEAVVTEAGRLKPTVSALFLEPNEDVQLADVQVPAGTAVAFILRPDANDDRCFAQAGRFDPDRWLRRREAGSGPDTAPAAHEPRAHAQFGAGARVCPGRHLATVEMRLVLSMLMRNFEIELACTADQIREVTAFATVPDRMPVRLRLL